MKYKGDPTSLNEIDVQAFAPLGAKVFRDAFNGRWRLWLGERPTLQGRWSTSKSWGSTADETLCVKHILRDGWQRFMMMHGDEQPLNLLLLKAAAEKAYGAW